MESYSPGKSGQHHVGFVGLQRTNLALEPSTPPQVLSEIRPRMHSGNCRTVVSPLPE